MKRTAETEARIARKTFPSRPTLRGLDWLNFLLADVQTGVGPFLAIYLAGVLFLASAALAAFAILYFRMPETRNARLENA